jgi:hypothetical protein
MPHWYVKKLKSDKLNIDHLFFPLQVITHWLLVCEFRKSVIS